MHIPQAPCRRCHPVDDAALLFVEAAGGMDLGASIW
jgi:hypothetical protein